jgi:hypothetical protein
MRKEYYYIANVYVNKTNVYVTAYRSNDGTYNLHKTEDLNDKNIIFYDDIILANKELKQIGPYGNTILGVYFDEEPSNLVKGK